MSFPSNTNSNESGVASSVPKSPTSGGFFGWMRQNPDAAAIAGTSAPKPRSRRDSSSLTADEALNISRANARPVDIPRTLPETTLETGPSSPRDIPRSKPRYDKLGLIAAFSGGPGSF